MWRWSTIKETHTPQRPSQPRMMKCSLFVRSKEWISGVATTPTCNSPYNFKCIPMEFSRERGGLKFARTYCNACFLGPRKRNCRELQDWAREISISTYEEPKGKNSIQIHDQGFWTGIYCCSILIRIFWFTVKLNWGALQHFFRLQKALPLLFFLFWVDK